MMAMTTRKKTEHALFGQPSSLPPLQLPINLDVLLLVWKYKCDDVQKKYANVDKIIKEAAKDITDAWEKAIANRKSVPLLPQCNVEKRLRRLYDKGLEVNKNKNMNRKRKFTEEMQQLFDICTCCCPIISCEEIKCKLKGCDGAHLNCKFDLKVAKREISS